MRARRWRHGQLEADERHTLKETLYFRNELLMMLGQAGFDSIRIEDGYEHADPTPDSATGHALNQDHPRHGTWTCGWACNDLVVHMRT